MRKWLQTMGLVSVLGIAGTAFAAMPAFDEVDANDDGVLSQSEASAVKGLDFAKADTNADGKLDRAEYDAATS